MTAWSYSSLTSFETCPRRHQLTRITKQVVEPESDAIRHGNEVHKALELAVKGEAPLPEKYRAYAPLVAVVAAHPGQTHTEMKFGLTRNLTPTGFFGADVWCRGVIDVCTVHEAGAVALDWKTGKPKTDADQLKLFAGAVFALFPQVETVRTGYIWLAHNKLDREKFTRAELPAIWQEFMPRVERMNAAEQRGQYPPRPSGLCRAWCPVPHSMCEFSGRAG